MAMIQYEAIDATRGAGRSPVPAWRPGLTAPHEERIKDAAASRRPAGNGFQAIRLPFTAATVLSTVKPAHEVNAPTGAGPAVSSRQYETPSPAVGAARPAAAARRFEELMQAAQRGDGRAYARLLKDLTPLLRSAVQRRRSFLDAADVEDLVQETLMSLHVARATYDPGRPFLPWLYALLVNRMADAARRHARRATHEVQSEEFERACEAVPDRDHAGSYRDPQLLAQAIRKLPQGQRTAVELLKLQELSLEKASALTGTSVGALKTAMHRALVSLRGRLGAAAAE
jgi:RNA polymerase sigma-70 factor (ECF subfamily)